MIGLRRLMTRGGSRYAEAAWGRPFSLGPAMRVDPARNRIDRDGREIAVEPRVMELLVYLARRPGVVVSKSELIEQVWRAHVVDEAVHRAMSLLRTALGDSAQQPTIVETVPRRGYRLMVAPGPRRLAGRTYGYAAGIAAVLLLAMLSSLAGNAPVDPAPPVRAMPRTAAAAIETPAPQPQGNAEMRTDERRIDVARPAKQAAVAAVRTVSTPTAPMAPPRAGREPIAPPAPTPRAFEAPRDAADAGLAPEAPSPAAE